MIFLIVFYGFSFTTTQIIATLVNRDNSHLPLSSIITSCVTAFALFMGRFLYPGLKVIVADFFNIKKIRLLLKYSVIRILISISSAYIYLYGLRHFQVTDKQDVASAGFWQYLLLGLLIAPSIEELLFRRILVPSLYKRYSVLVTIVLSSLIFAMVHPTLSFVPVFLLGMRCAWV